MNRYDPEQWLALDEQVRVDLAEEHHCIARIKLPTLKAHAALHAIVKNQIAQNIGSVVRAMTRLIAGGLSRHGAIHAIASVLAEHIYELFDPAVNENNSASIYNAAIERLTARSWRRS